MDRLRNLLPMLVLLMAGLMISAPAAVRGMHTLTHAGSPVAVGEHHHHGDGGDAATNGADKDANPKSQDNAPNKFGHSHISHAGLEVLSDPSGAVPPMPFGRSNVPAVANPPVMSTLGWSPQKRPPRTA